jgi:Zn-dependent protease with chaperone function
MALAVASISTAAVYYGGSDIILGSLGAEKLNMQIPEHRELHNIVTEMALASGSSMPRVYVIFDPAPNALATGTSDRNASICVTSGLLALMDREETQGVIARDLAHSQRRRSADDAGHDSHRGRRDSRRLEPSGVLQLSFGPATRN